MDVWNLLLDIVLLLSASLILGGVFSRFRQSPLLGYLIAGMILGGPGSVNMLQSEQDIESIAELGVALLLFSLGLEFSWRRLRALGGRTLLSGALQVIVTGLLAFGVCQLIGTSIPTAIAIAAMISLSSTACCLRVLTDTAQLDSAHGRMAIAVLLVQDLAVVPLAIMLDVLGEGSGAGSIAGSLFKLLGMALLLFAVLYVLVNRVAVWAFGALTMERNRELTVLLAVATGLGSTWAAHAAGLSPALGAFVAGLFLGGSRFATQIRADVSSLRVVLLTLFFGSAGMAADPIWIARNLPLVLGVSLAIVAGKALVVAILARWTRMSHASSVAAGLSLAQIGEFAFVLAGIALSGGVISQQHNAIIVSCAIVTLLATPPLITGAPRIGAFVQRSVFRQATPAKSAAKTTAHPDVILVGFGPAGRHVGSALRELDVPAAVLDLNAESKRAATALGLEGHIGDATQEDVLAELHVERARLVIITLPDRHAALTTLAQVRRLAPHAYVITRCRYDRYRDEFAAAGAAEIVQDEQQAGTRLAASVRLRISRDRRT